MRNQARQLEILLTDKITIEDFMEDRVARLEEAKNQLNHNYLGDLKRHELESLQRIYSTQIEEFSKLLDGIDRKISCIVDIR